MGKTYVIANPEGERSDETNDGEETNGSENQRRDVVGRVERGGEAVPCERVADGRYPWDHFDQAIGEHEQREHDRGHK